MENASANTVNEDNQPMHNCINNNIKNISKMDITNTSGDIEIEALAPKACLVEELEENVSKSQKSLPHVSLRNLGHMVLMLQKGLKRVACPQYWRKLADYRGEENKRCERVMELQRQRIATLEHDLQALVNLARETQQMLAEISADKIPNAPDGQNEQKD